jgi:transposase-like protein
MTNKYTKKIPTKVKRQIVSESLDPGCVVSKLASKYGVSKQSIYFWRKELFVRNPQASTSDPMTNSYSFVELPIINVDPMGNDTKQNVLEKASLIFRDFSLVLEGKVPTSNLLSILKILEESC